jgi:hypothetical protein
MISTPCSSSALIGEASSTAGCGTTGRRFANSPSALRSCSRPCSGRTLEFGSDHFGPPTAPSRIASAPAQPRASPPAAARRSRRSPRRRATPLRIERNGRSARNGFERAQRLGRDFGADAVAGENRDQRVHHGSRKRALRFVTLDVGELAAQIAEFVEPLSRQWRANASIGKATLTPSATSVAWCPSRRALRRPDCRAASAMRRGIDDDRQQAVLERVAAEDVGDAPC